MKHAIVAGVGPGLGLALVRRFAREGFAVSMLARDAAALERLSAEVGGDVKGYPADLCALDAVAAAFRAMEADRGPAEVMIYNAARWHEQPVMELDPMTFNWDLALCATGALVCAQAVWPAMKAAGRGSLLFTGGGLALYPSFGAGVASLTAGKSALRGLVHAMAGEVGPAGVHAATVTVAGTIKPGTALDPDRIAEEFWVLHQQPKDAWEVERVVKG